ncbi:MAG: DUF2497 domain-containing protein [Hyphomicrobiales bacterium]|nr:MAG: DUF2497 domain-containing protein [Hyphomicrobiales bacterium]
MANVNQDQEPSMEEILASIRRIISDDDADGGAAKADAKEEMSQDDLDALFDAPEPAAEEPMSQDDLDALFDAPEPAAEEPMSQDDLDALFDGDGGDDSGGEDVLDLTEDLAVEDDLDMTPDESDIAFAEPEPEPEPEPVVAEEPIIEAAMDAVIDEVVDGEQLLSAQSDAAASAAFANLANTILSNNARTLEDLVREMLRPMLKTWLDDNLPTLVERLVRQEIERVSRGR